MEISKNDNINVVEKSSQAEQIQYEKMFQLLNNSPIPPNELIHNLALFQSRQDLSRVLFMNELYQKIINVHGSIMEFGVRWGQNLTLFTSFRGIYEPFNYNRKIIGFDTWEGFPKLDEKDGAKLKEGDYATAKNYDEYLNQLLDYHESFSPISHIKKFELIKGDATVKSKEYFEKHPETIVALAYFDFDIYLPTKECLLTVKEHMPKGGIIAFDELNCSDFPGETIAMNEVFGIKNVELKRLPYAPLCSYFEVK